MADSPPDTRDDAGRGPGRGSTTGTPRWVKVFGTIALVLVVLIAGLMLFGGGRHGPGRHTGSGDDGRRTPPASLPEDNAPTRGEGGGPRPPEGGH